MVKKRFRTVKIPNDPESGFGWNPLPLPGNIVSARFLKIVFLLYFWPQTTNRHSIMLFFRKMKKTKYSDFFGPEKSSNPKIFLFLKFSNSGQPSRLFKKMGLCDFSVNGTPIDKLLNFTCNKMKKEKKFRKKSEKFARNPKKNRKKIDEKMMFFFIFEVPTDKNIFAARFFFFF